MEHRAVFDFVLTFTNGGRLQGQGFRLDVPRPGLTATEVAPLLVSHLGLLMVAEVQLAHLGFVEEPHRGSRGVPRENASRDRVSSPARSAASRIAPTSADAPLPSATSARSRLA